MSQPERRISAAMLRLASRHPFFASLALFAKTRVSECVDTAATNGKDIYFNPTFLAELSPGELDGVLLHEVLHAALLHVSRRGDRDPMRWNIAADIVVSNIIDEQGLSLPPGAIRNTNWADRSVEEIYLLLKFDPVNSPFTLDLRGDLGGDEGGVLSENQAAALRAHWRMANQQAQVIARQRSRNRGTAAGNMGREWDQLNVPQVDWRAELWRYLVQTPVDFEGFDRRFVYRGLYIDQMQGESLQLWVAIDTSGSISNDELTNFMSELQGILRSYPRIQCKLYFADAALYGPHQITGDGAMPEPVGGGGTSFVPFFDALESCGASELPYVCVYLTDGYGSFPEQQPAVPTLWLVTPGGLLNDGFPFGNVVRMLS